MKKIKYILILIVLPLWATAQQYPFMEGYTINSFQLSPSYAGVDQLKTLFIDHRTDWAGVDGGPRTYQLSYHDRLFDNVGIGGRMVFDKTDIFKTTLIMGSYSYQVNLNEKHKINFAISGGFYGNSINLGEYYNDPEYVNDAALTYGMEKSKIKLATDFSVLYRFKGIESGLLFSNLMFGTANYVDTDLTYKPMKNYLIHASYTYDINEKFTAKPFLLLRGGQNIPLLAEFAGQVSYNKRFWGKTILRSGGIWGIGFGGEVYDGLLINYSYNFSSNIALDTFGSHQLTLGVRIFSLN